MNDDRRGFLRMAALTAASRFLPEAFFASPGQSNIRVLVWDERQDNQKEAYDNFLGNHIAGELRKHPSFTVTSVALDDAEQGLSKTLLDNTDVLIWWGHVRQKEVLPEMGKKIAERISLGALSLIALHSAHWSTPFVEAMNEITRRRVAGDTSVADKDISYVQPPQQYTVPKYDSRLTPYSIERKFPDGTRKIAVHLPFCCFPAYRNDGKPSTVRVLQPAHPILKGIPSQFQLPRTEMYDEPFHVPEPDMVLFEEYWAGGEWFRSGMLWQLGKGKIFYFRPGHETYAVFKEKWPIQVLANAVEWMASGK